MSKQDSVAISQDTMLHLCLAQLINHHIRNSHFSVHTMLFHLAAAFTQSPLKLKKKKKMSPLSLIPALLFLVPGVECTSLQTSTYSSLAAVNSNNKKRQQDID